MVLNIAYTQYEIMHEVAELCNLRTSLLLSDGRRPEGSQRAKVKRKNAEGKATGKLEDSQRAKREAKES